MILKYIDINYQIKNNIEIREQGLILFGLKEKLNNLDCKNTEEYFLDSAYKIIPPLYRPYKLLVCAGIPKKKKILL